MNINKESAYLRGLLEGYELDSNKKETKLFTKMLELIDAMADHITALEADNAELREYVEELDHDLGEVEEEVYFVDEDEDYDEEDDGFIEVECPACGEMVCFDADIDPENLVCPACGEEIKGIELCDGDCANCNDETCKAED